MKNRSKLIALTVGILMLALGASSAEAAMAFRVTLTNQSSNVLTPAPFISHNSSFDLFSAGDSAGNNANPTAVQMLAEGGDTTGVVAMAEAAKMAGGVLDFQIAGMAPITPGNSETISLLADELHSMMSFMSMLAVSNDAFIGGAYGDGAISLYSSGAPVFGSYSLLDSNVWDAGTEVNDELAVNVPALMGAGSVDENGVIAIPHAGILGIGDIDPSFDWRGAVVAEISVAPVPIPGAVLLLGSGLIGLVGLRRRVRKT
jgi:hypothetical protein